MASPARKSATSHLKIAPTSGAISEPQRTISLIDDPMAPEFFTSRCVGYSIGQGNVTLTFESLRCNHFDPNGGMNRVVVGRIIMPVEAAQALVVDLNASLQGAGLSPSRAATAGMVAQ
jgi:hypothetical protein